MTSQARSKAAARKRVWDALEAAGVERFPYPPHGRIPNFEGARRAAERLFELPLFQNASVVKVNPDAPQLPVRRLALEHEIRVFVPTPRLRGGFLELDPQRIPAAERRKAASLSGMERWARAVALEDLPHFDALVVGSVAVSRAGARCGKGEGYADLEYGILRSLGHPPPPVLTTVHPLQITERVEREPLDLPLEWIVTPDETVHVDPPPSAPDGIDWDRLGDDRLDEMPVLRELREKLKV